MMTYYNPPKNCDICNDPIGPEFSDVRVPAYDRWGNLCPTCATSHGVSYGTGLGQRYVLMADHKYHKVEG